jgi:hypothetical protein
MMCDYVVNTAVKNVNSHYLLAYTRIFRYIVITINFQCSLRDPGIQQVKIHRSCFLAIKVDRV